MSYFLSLRPPSVSAVFLPLALTDGFYVIARLSHTATCNRHHSLVISLRRVPSGEDRGFVQREVPCDQEAGVGPLLHRMAMLGHTVSHTQRVFLESFT